MRDAHEPELEITGLCFAQDGRTFASRGADATLKVTCMTSGCSLEHGRASECGAKTHPGCIYGGTPWPACCLKLQVLIHLPASVTPLSPGTSQAVWQRARSLSELNAAQGPAHCTLLRVSSCCSCLPASSRASHIGGHPNAAGGLWHAHNMLLVMLCCLGGAHFTPAPAACSFGTLASLKRRYTPSATCPPTTPKQTAASALTSGWC